MLSSFCFWHFVFGDCLGYLIYSVLSADLEIVFGIEDLDPKPTLDPDSDANLGHIIDSDLETGLGKERLMS
ncbi:13076_t:CDS:2 [Cetraspora pellucida]|uniref:13076_t:CDS:1 n=1 Tax=Cetraspora pellucida TaxID=1433469 RepID=A0A9N9CHP9_9GLOM|nr:13076_t:CDS:2 [Cetraspora pellucida]